MSNKYFKWGNMNVHKASILCCIADASACIFVGKKAKTVPGKIFGVAGVLTGAETVGYLVTRHVVKKDAIKKGYKFIKFTPLDYYKVICAHDNTEPYMKELGVIE